MIEIKEKTAEVYIFKFSFSELFYLSNMHWFKVQIITVLRRYRNDSLMIMVTATTKGNRQWAFKSALSIHSKMSSVGTTNIIWLTKYLL